MATLTPTPVMQFFDANGNPLVGGKLYTYASGTSTPLATYTDSGALTPNPNPVILNSRGEAAIWLGTSAYTFVLNTPADTLIWSADGIAALATTGSVAAVAANLQAFITLMSSSAGAANVGYTPGGIGAVATTVQTKLRESVSVKDFGAVGDGTHDDTAALSAALTALQGTGGCLYFPTGEYKITTSLTYTAGSAIQSIKLMGDGSDSTIINWPNANGGLVFNLSSQTNSVHFNDITFTTAQANSGTAITVNQADPLLSFAMNTFYDCTFRGYSSPYGDDFWATCVLISNLSGTTWDGITMYGGGGTADCGNGIVFRGTGTLITDPDYSIYHNISKSIFNSLSFGITYGTFAQGITVSQSNFQNGAVGIYIPAGGIGLSQLNVIDNQFATTLEAITMLSPVGTYTIRGNDVFIAVATPQGSGFDLLEGGVYGTIIGNQIQGPGAATGAVGIALGNCQKCIVNSNTISLFNVGVDLLATSYGCLVQGNNYNVNNNNVTNAGSSNYIYQDESIPAANVTPGASPWTYTAGASPETHYIRGGTVSLISVNGTYVATATDASVPLTINLRPYDSYIVTYSVVPTVIKAIF